MKNAPDIGIHVAVPGKKALIQPVFLEVAETGGRFLTNRSGIENTFTREKLSSDQQVLHQRVQEFVRNDVTPQYNMAYPENSPQLSGLLRKAAALGILESDINNGYDQVGLNSIDSALISEALALGKNPEFALTLNDQVNHLIDPLALFSDSEQRKNFLGDLLSGKAIGAYPLKAAPEDNALVALAHAGGFLLNGRDRFISNGSGAGLLLVLAQIDGELSAFVLEASLNGVTIEPEEGLVPPQGFSIVSIRFNNVRVHHKNLLHELGKGSDVTGSTVHLGHLKRAACLLGQSRQSLNDVLQYALERRRFSRALAHLNLVKGKIADMVLQTYAMDSMVYRTAGYLNQPVFRTRPEPENYSGEVVRISEKYAIECAIVNVFAREAFCNIIEASRQVRTSETVMEQPGGENTFWNPQLERLYDGHHPLNRQLIATYFYDKALAEEIPLQERIRQFGSAGNGLAVPEGPLKAEMQALEIAKQLTIYLFNQSMIQYKQDLLCNQQIVELLSNLFIDIYAMDSCICRANQQQGDPLHLRIARAFCAERILEVGHKMEMLLYSLHTGDRLDQALRRFYGSKKKMNLKYNVFKLKQEIAEHLYSCGEYPY